MPPRMSMPETFHPTPLPGYTDVSMPPLLPPMRSMHRMPNRFPPNRFMPPEDNYMPLPPHMHSNSQPIYQEIPERRPRKFPMDGRRKPEFFDSLSYSEGC
mgnify:CR=1 FL=1